MRISVIALASVALLSGCASSRSRSGQSNVKQQVTDTERAFAHTMAARDHAAFKAFVSAEAVFFSGERPLHGKQEIADWWKRYFVTPEVPFSWEPERIEVLGSGTLALSTGPVHDPKGKLIGTFTSIWRLEKPGEWRIIFDKGDPVCDKP